MGQRFDPSSSQFYLFFEVILQTSQFRTSKNAQEFLTALKIIYLALMAGLVLLTLVAIYFVKLTEGIIPPDDGSLHKMFQYLVPGFALINVMMAYFLYGKRLQMTYNIDKLSYKLEIYRSINILKAALFEGPGLLAAIGYLLIGQSLYLIVLGFILAVFAVNRPSKEKLISELKLSYEDKEIIENNLPLS